MSGEKDPPGPGDFKLPEDYRERFLRANANPEYVSSLFANVLRRLMRAVGAQSHWEPARQAAAEIYELIEFMQHAEKPFTLYEVFEKAVEEIREGLPEEDGFRDRYVYAAMAGLMFLVEASAPDNAARGRASKRLQSFISAMESALDRRR